MAAEIAARQVTVIGGGIVGLLCARALQAEGLSVRVLERNGSGDGCSTGNAGSVSAGSVAPIGMPGMWRKVPGWMLDPDGPFRIQASYLLRVCPWLARFVKESSVERVETISHGLRALTAPSIELYRQLTRDLGTPELLQVTGQIQLYRSDDARRSDSAVWNLRRARGVELSEIGSGEIHELEPSVSPSYSHGIWLPNEGSVLNPGRLVRALQEDFQRRGGEVLNRGVQGFDMGPSGPVRVRTDAGSIPVESILVCAGAWSHVLAQELGSVVPLETQRGYHVVLPDSGLRLGRPVVATDRKIFVTSMEMGLRIAGTVEFGALRSPPNYRRARSLLKHGRALLPSVRTERFTEWMGNRPCTPDSLPVIGPSPRYPSVHFAFGHGHLGLTCAPMTARIVAATMLDRQPPVDLAPYRVDRF